MCCQHPRVIGSPRVSQIDECNVLWKYFRMKYAFPYFHVRKPRQVSVFLLVCIMKKCQPQEEWAVVKTTAQRQWNNYGFEFFLIFPPYCERSMLGFCLFSAVHHIVKTWPCCDCDPSSRLLKKIAIHILQHDSSSTYEHHENWIKITQFGVKLTAV